MKKIVFTKDEKIDIYNMYYEEKKSFKIIQEKYKVSQTVLRRIFIENNWQIRKRTDQFIKYSVDESYFDIIDNSDKAYCLGLLYADGCNHTDSNTIDIELQDRDVFVLQKMNSFLHNTRPLKFYSSVNSINRKKDTYKLAFRGEHISKQLSHLGMVARKSLTLSFPEWISKDYFPSFLRGYIDGDGWVQKYRIGLMSTDSFCNGVKSFLLSNYNIECHVMDMKRHYNEHTKTLYITNKRNLIPLTELMFRDCNIYIPRKLDKYLEYGLLTQTIYNSIVA